MIPYFEIRTIPIGSLHIQVWGLFVAIGVLLSAYIAGVETRRRKLDEDVMFDMITWMVVAGLIGARLVYVFGYAEKSFMADPISIFRIWEGGLSSFGAFFGGAIGAWLFSLRRHVNVGQYLDIACFVLPLGYGCGRIGCFLIHDHPGTVSNSFLAVKYPGGSRLDLGLLLAMVGFMIFGAFIWLKAFRPAFIARAGFAPLLMVSYGLARFVLDFFRANDLPFSDQRYVGLTLAQFASIGIVAAGIWLLTRKRNAYA